MAILIDGYNVLFAAGMIPRAVGPGELARARQWLIERLLRRLDTATRMDTVIVFDAKDAPKHVPDAYQISGIQVLFARDHEEADDLIEQKIRRESNPKKLLLITSDFRLRQLAQRRRAKTIKSEDWLDQTDDADVPTTNRAIPTDDSVTPREQLLGDSEVERWLDDFRLSSAADTDIPLEPEDTRAAPPASGRSATTPQTSRHRAAKKPDLPLTDSPRDAFDWGPFPPGYGEDLLE